jgi:NitT/TauT family transport system ATP-binding protein
VLASGHEENIKKGDTTMSSASAASGTDSHITIAGLNHRFSTGLQAVKDADLQVRDGELVVIVGPSGCGKTTILNIIAGLVPAQDGTVNIAGSAPACGRRDVAYMFAQDALLPWRTVLGNALFGVEIHLGKKAITPEVVAQAKDILKNIGLEGFENFYPRQLSHGMRQRAALARTFMLPSPLLLMDEPFGALDAHTKLTLQQELLTLWERNRRTVLFITHDLAEAIFLADRILVCSARPGHIVADIPIPFARPRDLKQLQQSDAYHKVYQQVWAELSREMDIHHA